MAKTNSGIKKLSMKKLQGVLSKFAKPMQLLDQIIYNINKSVIPVENYALLAANEKPVKLSMIDNDDNPLLFVSQCATVYEGIPAFTHENKDYYIVQTLKSDQFTVINTHSVSYNVKVMQEINPYAFIKAALVTKEDPTKPAFLTVTHNDEVILTVLP